MPNKPLLSVAIVVQNQRDVIETTLSSLYELRSVPFELFIIDDGSTDGSDEVIQSLLDYHQHEQTFYFSHDRSTGRGNALNEALLQCNGQLFWAPKTIQQINENELAKRLEQLASSTNAAILQQHQLPGNHQQWMDRIHRRKWPQDGTFIWNLSIIDGANRFFNPYLRQYHGMELACRLGELSCLTSDTQWYRPSSFLDAPALSADIRQEVLLTLLRQIHERNSARKSILETLATLGDNHQSKSFDNDLLNEAVQMMKDGRFNAALELVETYLEDNPDHREARKLKIRILEKKRRFVEASELKYEFNKSQKEEAEKDQSSPPQETAGQARTSVIIPTTAHGKPALEHCLLSISEHCDTDGLELIIIDNASLDDTHDYLNELKEKHFLNCRVITNQKNKGFAASINQGLQMASGEYSCIMHNDIELQNDAIKQLYELMEAHPRYAVMGPMTNKTLNPDQASRNAREEDPELLRTEYLDSFCMMIRNDTDLRMDEAYQLTFFEDIDLCFQARSENYKVGIAPHVEVTHHFGTTTFALNLDTESEQYWKNVAYFNDKWDIEVLSEEELKSLSTFDQLLALDDLVNPLYPEEEIKEQFNRLFTDELKTEILNTQHDGETLCKLVHLFMVMNEREVMRRLEDRLDNIDLPASLIYQLIRFYFDRNIYSRCIHYLERLKPQNKSLSADIYWLAIHVENKDLEQAIPMLRELMDRAPSNPMLYKLAGDIHKFNGNREEASSFYDIAEQINPFDFVNEEKDAFGFEL